jgi:hypothetical protein
VKIWKLDLNVDESIFDYTLLGQIKYDDVRKSSKAREAILSLCMFGAEYLIISTVLNNYYVYLDMDRIVCNSEK